MRTLRHWEDAYRFGCAFVCVWSERKKGGQHFERWWNDNLHLQGID
jgi:hypothetical protein